MLFLPRKKKKGSARFFSKKGGGVNGRASVHWVQDETIVTSRPYGTYLCPLYLRQIISGVISTAAQPNTC